MGRAFGVYGGEHSLLVGKPDRKRPLKESRRTLGDSNTRQEMYVQRNIEVRSCSHSYSGKALSIAYYGFVCVCVSVLVALGRGYTRDWLPTYSFVLRARARRDTTRQDCFVVIPAHTGVTIVHCGTVVPSCSCMENDVVWCLINKLMFLSSWHTWGVT
jgi:hypothetical protein